MSRKRKRNKTLRSYTPLSRPQKKGTVLQSPYSSLPFQMYDWTKDLLPECLWIAAVINHFGKDQAHKFYYKFMDVIDECWPDSNSAALGRAVDRSCVGS